MKKQVFGKASSSDCELQKRIQDLEKERALREEQLRLACHSPSSRFQAEKVCCVQMVMPDEEKALLASYFFDKV
ncbi:hypothetical protein P4S93_04345 [Aneurinibacillus thermoaerophilus]|uniref:Uncharacterized protein n=1 Tax=Aneurinibacillus thermoaerophilus TaxID=143495 RepID=A0ABX8YDM1_ANETH|nr:hypothetical protein [Aneurinibacillus thermoaerophilus]MED0676216.1 hypothetical protein [Aneurinibacillus thermoaerophilus]MED0678148.1 hypothetical protein [Aneurinibacillus thermoaerophilus]MED0755658.1 hypothetical protein [Aneurinibacillus thermoaerophilus]MED0760013.1 hypothetical protein [Aneurinibacillus thermoaerophilus]MED0764231.1 hypothetical protein [Aneurinibacillus thermoaerophilus]